MENNIPQFGTKEFYAFFSDLCDKNIGGNSKNKSYATSTFKISQRVNRIKV
jgi:hypothetical protein